MRQPAWMMLVPALLVGCGQSDGRHQIKGTITWQGNPVPAGSIVFEPDTAKGNQGPAGVAEIHEGRFITGPEFGARSGPHIARFQLCDGKSQGDMAPHGLFLTPEIRLEVDLPAEGGTLDFALPRE
ncbi:MAG: hypothetical protein AB7K24_23810 [Gemmataceae bacterium]